MPDPKRQLPRRVYPLRVLGMGLGAVVVSVVLWERNASVVAWLYMALITLAWPHVAYQLSRRSADPYRAEIRNLLVDSALVAALVPLMHFNLLPSVLLLTLTMVDKITTGIHGLWARSLPGMAGAAAASAALTGFHWAPVTSMLVIIACLPVMVLHTLSVSVVSYRLIRKVSQQNQLLDELRRIDALTGLYGRGHWQEQAEATLRRHHATDEPACLVMLDIDHFKQINDRHGHTVGDEVLRALARIVLNNVRATDCAGRYGGDEFAIVLRGMHLDNAILVAQRIREQVQALQLHDLPSLRFTSSLGVAAADHRHNSLRAWTNAADAELYQAKAAGRNRVSAGAMPVLAPVV
ncbi:diguanylate cyclase AdrA [Acidovorax carolinensis]|uniref:diguanylate cyclase n=1 Tax=Acidovorax carolinensis TaxID=553814 RepID=A0A240UGD1_9BURK|nr:sensor domain-containing diguanylate cyclase [Acidovorax carolinensis]ART54264.1 diguanylate cyclase AdrA [Acidovorax carolinensis]ART60112.1 diguanylate cyclase AdrA [Acidovorax carolinensis]